MTKKTDVFFSNENEATSNHQRFDTILLVPHKITQRPRFDTIPTFVGITQALAIIRKAGSLSVVSIANSIPKRLASVQFCSYFAKSLSDLASIHQITK